MRSTLTRYAFSLALSTLIASATHASIPSTIPLQAVVKTAGGTAVTTATPVTFSLYTAATGGAAVWTEVQTVTPSSSGLISVQLGSVNPLTGVPFDQSYYVGVKIGSDAEMTPRLPLGSVPYAFSALSVPYSGITGSPSSLPPSGAAGGDLAGSYPNPVIAANAITSGKLASDAASLLKVSGGAMTSSSGNIGIGSTAPGNGRLDVVTGSVSGQAIDQQQTNYSYHIGLASHWQSFTAGTTGVMTALTLGVFTPFTGTLSIRSGEGTSGALLLSQPVNFSQNFADVKVPLASAVPVTAGQKYTWIVDVSTATGYQLFIQDGNPYAGGRSGYDASFDYFFQTFVGQAGPNADALFVGSVSGDVGIGTAYPVSRLDVRGGGVLTDNVFGFTSAQQGSTPADTYISAPAGATLGFFTASAERMRINDSGKVGIGTSAPVSTLSVVQHTDSASIISIDSGLSSPQYSAIDLYDRGSAKWGMGKDNANHFYIAETGVGNHLAILPGGNVGIGTSAPSASLEVHGSVKLGASGQLFAAGGNEDLRIVRGLVNSNGSVNLGSGWSCTHASTGHYHLTFTTAFGDLPVTTTTPNAENVTMSLSGYSANGVDVTVKNGTSYVDAPWNFIAIAGK